MRKLLIIGILLLSIDYVGRAQDFVPEFELDSSSVSARVNPERLMRQIARNFVSKFADNYVCEIIQYRSVMMDDAYYEFNAYQGIYASLDFNQIYKGDLFHNPATKSYMAPLTVMRSYPYDLDGKTLKYSEVFGQGQSPESDYQNNPTNNLLLKKRSLEVASPLNYQLQKLFNYKIEGFFEDEEGEQYVSLIFETKEGVFPLKTPLKGRGRIVYNVLKRAVVSLYIEDHQDYYSIKVPVGVIYDSNATKHSLDVRYELIDGKLYTSTITLHADWIDPRNDLKSDSHDDLEVASLYKYIRNSRPAPYSSSLSEYERMEFSNFIYLSRQEAANVKGMISYIDMSELYMAQFREEKWKGVECSGVDMEKLRRDINKENLSLEQQARRSALSGYSYYWNTSPPREDKPSIEQVRSMKFPQEYFIHARTFIYPRLFNRSWSEF